MLLSIIKFFHIIAGISFFGITIAAFFYITRSIHKRDHALIDYSIKTSYFGDALILLCILIQVASAISLTSAGHFTLSVPWIFVAYHAFGFLILLWIINILIKKFLLSKLVIAPYSLKSFYYLNIVMIFVFMMIIHDAVTKSTCLAFLFGR